MNVIAGLINRELGLQFSWESIHYSEILEEKYLKHGCTDYALYHNLGMSESKFYEDLKKAVLDFAYSFGQCELLADKVSQPGQRPFRIEMAGGRGRR